MGLIGKQLAKQIPDTTTGNTARIMFGAMTSALSGAYDTLASYDLGGIAQATGLDAGSVQAAHDYLDSTNQMLQGYYVDMPATDDPLGAHQLDELKTAVSTSSVAVSTVDDLFGTSWLAELSDSIVAAANTVSAAVANTISKVAGSFIGGTWWIIALGLGGLYLWHKYGGSKLLT
jgi:hypothetical protein